jgi:uncharacterized protein YjbJ (UPF0337 family)
MGGEADKVAGRVKQAAGDLTGDEQTKADGKRQEVAGDVKNAGDKIKDKVDELGDRIK